MVNNVRNIPEFSISSWLLFQHVIVTSEDLNFESSFCQNSNVFTYITSVIIFAIIFLEVTQFTFLMSSPVWNPCKPYFMNICFSLRSLNIIFPEASMEIIKYTRTRSGSSQSLIVFLHGYLNMKIRWMCHVKMSYPCKHRVCTHWAEPFLRSCQLCSYSRTSQHFMDPGSSLPCSQ
jgi:hypothetical protein